MPSILPQRSMEHDRRYRRALVAGIAVSVLFHLGVVLLWRGASSLPPSPFSAAGPQAGDDRAAAGGGMRDVRLSVVAPVTLLKPPPPVPVPDAVVKPPPEVQPQPEVHLSSSPATTQAAVGQPGEGDTGAGPGRADGTGRGAGGTEAEGRFHAVPPSPRGLILPPADRPKNVRGKEVQVWVFVTAAGDVIADSTRLVPGTGDSGFDRRLRELAAEWVFDPARKGGHAIAEWFRYTLVL
jgi:hypothetical protein